MSDGAKRILHVSHSMNIGGAERALFQLIRGQLEEGYEPGLAVISKAGHYGKLVAELGVPVVELQRTGRFDRQAAARFATVAASYECVHFQTQAPGLMKSIADMELLRVYTHRGGEPRYGFVRGLMHRRTGRVMRSSMHAISGNTAHAARVAPMQYNLQGTLAAREIPVTYNGIDFNLLKPKRSKAEVLSELGEDPSQRCFRIGTSANLRRLKRIDLLLHATAKLRDKAIRVYLIGEGPARAELQQLARRLGIDRITIFTGQVTHMGDYLQLFDAFALPSDAGESFGNSAVEAMGLGIPTLVMRDGGGMVEHYPDDLPGLPTDANGLAARLQQWIDDPAAASDFANRCREYVTTKYTLKNMVQGYRSLYSVAAKNAGRVIGDG